jgi:hypothetical protein
MLKLDTHKSNPEGSNEPNMMHTIYICAFRIGLTRTSGYHRVPQIFIIIGISNVGILQMALTFYKSLALARN